MVRKANVDQIKRIREITGASLGDVAHLLTVLDTDEEVIEALRSRVPSASSAVQLFVLRRRLDALTRDAT